MVQLNEYRKTKATSKVGDLTSLIDVIFLLLIFVLLTSVTASPINSERVEASIGGDNLATREVLYIQITSPYSVMINSTSYSLEKLYSYFENGTISKETPLTITSFNGALHSDVLSLIAPLVEMGWSNISFIVE